ncbi:serine/threonine-protein kinase fused isoform X1 [Anopheles maculipalpis]|uniref:serine/threonine-protein kinase fused isoform X1 n=1 Tax=Anopheles maculipalpis TaxID=1496333 RepID=UPI0021593B6C|nr:serine/threonine-protein kinase fused isoform X1 [Anopheles maculipalpis]XP_050068797.1 serine/threonine-protein kinase fused isoform X1 [Anopheles maculipalpis]XP_050068798.1 serine/threonine-protein kinase fused isoform X1 [Anopheles maculipalpis]
MEKYVLSDLIGEGSFGKVYKAVEKSSATTVAIKIINKRGRSGRELKGLRGECEIQRNLKHPNIIRMLNSFETNNEIIVVTEYAKTDLHSLLRDGSLEEPRTQRITFNLVSALYYLHSHRILHRDLKPQNILLDRNMCAKLCDFGFARNMTMGTHVLTSIKGTPLYMAPELLEAKPYDHHADLWSLGCIIYEMLAGEPPFSSTSMIHLVRLIRHQYIKWPSFLTSNCISFVQGLLERDPAKRINWDRILNHPFVKGHIVMVEENVSQSPFTHPFTGSRSQEQKHQSPNHNARQNASGEEDLSTSKDSINVMLQSDIDYQETDTDEFMNNTTADNDSLTNGKNIVVQQQTNNFYDTGANAHQTKIVQFLENPNLVVNRFNDNFPILPLQRTIPSVQSAGLISDVLELQASKEYTMQGRIGSQELERRKLSQSIDNFSIRIESEMNSVNRNPSAVKMSGSSIAAKELQNDKGIDKITPSLLPGWDSCDESQNPPIENEEWLAFLQRSIQEVLDGELESLKQQNFVCIIVAPLRNRRASAKVVENVAHLLSLPLAISTPPSILRDIINVYGELKLVPNLVYASKLLCNTRFSEDSSTNESQPGMSGNQSICSVRQVSTLDNDEIKTLIAVYDLICYLIHMGDIFLNQFCDAIEILGAKELFVNFIAAAHVSNEYVQLVCSLLALLNCALRELPENAEIIEQIVFHENVNIMLLLKHDNAFLRLRTCMLLRILARFSCLALQKRWANEIKDYLEELLLDDDPDVQKEAKSAMEEFKYISCVTAETC